MGERTRNDLKPLMFSGGDEMEINDYDRVRKVIPFKDSRSLPIGARTLSTEMSCPICLDLLSQTMTAKECLHRFCSECITMALQRGNKECPTCRKKLVSKRSLRPDPSFDLLIAKVWPDRSIYENLQTHELQFGREDSPEDDEEVVRGPDGSPIAKKKKTGYDPEKQNKRRLAEEEEFPELNGEQAFMEREEIDNLLEHGGNMYEHEDYNEDDDVYGDELELDESGNVVESSRSRQNQEKKQHHDEEPEPSGEYDPYAYTEDNEEPDFEEFDTLDSNGALTAEQQEELQNDLDELETVEYEDFELDFSDEEQPEEETTAFNPDEDNGIRCTSSDEEDDETSEEDDDEETEDEEVGQEAETIEPHVSGSGTEDSSPDSSVTASPKGENNSPEEKPGENAEVEIDGDATPPAYAPEMEAQANKTPPRMPGAAASSAGEEAKKESPTVEKPPLPSAPLLSILPPSIMSKPSGGIPMPKDQSCMGELEPVQFTPPREDEDDDMMGGGLGLGVGTVSEPSLSGPSQPSGGIFGQSYMAPQSLEHHLGIIPKTAGASVIAIAPSLSSGVIIKEERVSPPPLEATPSTDITVIEPEEVVDSSSDSTTTTYSSSGCTSSSSSLSSDISVVKDWESSDEEEVIIPPNNGLMDVTITEGDVQFPAGTSSMVSQPGSSSYKGYLANTTLTAFSEELPPHREIDPEKMEEGSIDEIRPPSSTIPSTDRLSHWLANSPSSPQSVDEDMATMPQRRADDCDMVEPINGSEEIEAELLPASSLLQRECPDELLIPRYVRAKHDTKMEHLAEFIHHRAVEEYSSNQTDFDADPVPNIPKPKHFYVFSRNGGHHVKQIFLHETMATALCAMTQGDHLIIFFDIAGIDLRGEKLSLLADVVPSHFLSLPTV